MSISSSYYTQTDTQIFQCDKGEELSTKTNKLIFNEWSKLNSKESICFPGAIFLKYNFKCLQCWCTVVKICLSKK